MAANPAPRQPDPPTLSGKRGAYYVTGSTASGEVRTYGPIARKGDAIMLLLRLGGVLALGEPARAGDTRRT